MTVGASTIPRWQFLKDIELVISEHWMRLRRSAGAIFAAAILVSATPVGAQAPPALAPLGIAGDAARGETLAYTCGGCHGIPGYHNAYPAYNVPKLGGQNADYIEVALQGYRRGTRPHPTMQAQASDMSDQDIADIAAYFASIESAPETGVSGASMETALAGEQKSVACQPCHGRAGLTDGPQWPHLAGQHASYLIEAMSQYRSGARVDLIMGSMMGTLDSTAIEELAAFYAALPGLYGTPQ